MSRASTAVEQPRPQLGLARDRLPRQNAAGWRSRQRLNAAGWRSRPRHNATGWRSRSRNNAWRSRMLVAGTGAVFVLVLAASTFADVFGRSGRGAAGPAVDATGRAAAAPSDAGPGRAAAVPSDAGPGRTAACSSAVSGWEGGSCQLVLQSARYANPLAEAKVIPERIDQGVDYAGSGTLTAIGAARVTYVAASAPGWPGAFIEYQLLGGEYRGRHVYYAEGVVPATGLHVGETVRAGQAIATIIPLYATGIEIGWGAGVATNTYAAERHQWSPTDDADNIPTAAGKSFSALIGSLGGPPGKVEG